MFEPFFDFPALPALLAQGRDSEPFEFREIVEQILRWLFIAFVVGGPILTKIFGDPKKKEAEKELEARRRSAEALRRQAEAQERALQGGESVPIPRASKSALPGTVKRQVAPQAKSSSGELGGMGPSGAEEEIERPWYQLDENQLERESSESILERDGPMEPTRAVGVFDTTDVTSIDDLAPLGTLAETHFDSLASEFKSRSSGSLLLKGTAASRRRKGVSRDSLRGAWRQAIVLREVLGTPVGMKSDREDLPGLR